MGAGVTLHGADWNWPVPANCLGHYLTTPYTKTKPQHGLDEERSNEVSFLQHVYSCRILSLQFQLLGPCQSRLHGGIEDLQNINSIAFQSMVLGYLGPDCFSDFTFSPSQRDHTLNSNHLSEEETLEIFADI